MSSAALAAYADAQALETYLGDPKDDALPFNYRRSVECDETDELPEAACRLLDDWGMSLYYFPEALGGRLRTFEQALALGRIVSRRDLAAAIEHSISFLGFAFVWLAGSPQLKKRAAAVLRDGGRIALGLTEREHGGDLSSCECRAELKNGIYWLSGEKWLINNATRGRAISLFARTDPRGGPRGFSFFFVEKSRLEGGSFEVLPKVLTHGIRGVDISGIRFCRAALHPDALIGDAGGGLELALRGLQMTRTMCCSLSLGALDTAIRIVLDFALRRRIYGGTVFDIAAARGTLIDAFVDLLISDCVSIAGARALHVAPAQMSVHSSIVKYFVPVTCERAVQSLAIVLGARHYLRQGHWSGLFQKILRDAGIVPLFDGSTAVNLNVLSSQLLALCQHADRLSSSAEDRLRQIFDLTAPVPDFQPDRLTLVNKGVHDIVQAIADLDRWLAGAKRHGDVSSGLIDDLDLQVQELKIDYAMFKKAVADNAATVRHSRGQTPEMFEMARRYCVFHAAAACVLLWVESRRSLDPFFARGEWLQLALRRLRQSLRPGWNIIPPPGREAVSTELRRRFRDGILFSVVPLTLAQRINRARTQTEP
jgi:alkylation response protein AidB-like acyl-CoA dehydrogenase